MGRGPAAAAAKGMPAISAPRGTKAYRDQIAAREKWVDDQLRYRGETLGSLGVKNEEGQARGVYRMYGPGGYLTREGTGISTNFIYDWATGKKLNVATNAEEFKNEAKQNSQGQWVFDPERADPSRWESITPEEYSGKSEQEAWMAKPENQGLTYADRVAEQGFKQLRSKGYSQQDTKFDPQSGLYWDYDPKRGYTWKDRFGRVTEGPKNFKPPVASTPTVPRPTTSSLGASPGGSAPPPPGTIPALSVPGAAPSMPAPQGTLSVPTVSDASYRPKYSGELQQAIMSTGLGAAPVAQSAQPGADLVQSLSSYSFVNPEGGVNRMPPSEPNWNPPDPGSPGYPLPPAPPPPASGQSPVPAPPTGVPPIAGGGVPEGWGVPPPASVAPAKNDKLSAQQYLSYTGDPLKDYMANLFNNRAGIFGTKNPFLSGATSRATDQKGNPLSDIAGTFLPGGGLWWGKADDLSSAINSLGPIFAPPSGGGGGGGGDHGGGGNEGGLGGSAPGPGPVEEDWASIFTPPGSFFGNVRSGTSRSTSGIRKPFSQGQARTGQQRSPLETRLSRLWFQ